MEISHKKLKVTLTVPDVFTGKHYVQYFDVMEDTAEKYNGQKFYIRAFMAAMAICEAGSWDGKDLKSASYEEVPMRVIKWVSDEVTDYIRKETEIPEA